MGLNLTFAMRLRERESALVDAMRDALAVYENDVAGEIALIHANYAPKHVAQSACVFAVVSPQADFAFNVAVTQPLRRALTHRASEAELKAIIRHYKLGLHNQKAKRLKAMQEVINSLSMDDMTVEVLRALNGFGPKCTSMSMALA